jgi:hypothetical protein
MFPLAFMCFNTISATNIDQPKFRKIFKPLGVENTTTDAVQVDASTSSIDVASGAVIGACDLSEYINLTVVLDKNGLITVVSNNEIDVSKNRANVIQQALCAFVHMVGNTINHEVGHALGLVTRVDPVNKITINTTTVTSPLDGDNGAHNKMNNNTNIMDAGPTRDFPRRVENTGKQQRFSTANTGYLRACIPYDIKDN